jgi:uncharacterized membrane protein
MPCVICDGVPTKVPSGTSVAIVTVVVVVCVLALLWDARARGARWVATLLGGIVFGEIVEVLNIRGAGCHGYCYPDVGPMILGVPLWVPIGWGGIIYASTWAASRLQIPWFGRAITAAFLAVSIDFSLDPVAELLGFWSWDAPPTNFLGVPYDNYAAWFLVVLVYSATATGLLNWWNPRGILAQVGTILVAELVAAVVLFVVVTLLTHFGYSPRGRQGHIAAALFMLALGVGVIGTLLHFRVPRPPSPSAGPVNWPVLVVPVVIHVTSYALYFAYARWQEPALIAAIPIQLLAGVFIFAQPWI